MSVTSQPRWAMWHVVVWLYRRREVLRSQPLFVEQLLCVRDLLHPWGAARSVRAAPWRFKAHDPSRREKRQAVLHEDPQVTGSGS